MGILVPLFSIPSTHSWGIGEIADLPSMAAWCRSAGCRVLQLLPVNEMPTEETSPYSSLSAMAIDPQYIALRWLDDFVALGGEPALAPDLAAVLDDVRRTPRVDYAGVRRLKDRVLRACFERFEAVASAERRASFERFIRDEASWLEDYALFRALRAAESERTWEDWPQGLRDRDTESLGSARQSLVSDVRYRQYLQWVAAEQWYRARRGCGNVLLFGDLPFMVSRDSADVWARQGEFRLDVSVGVPPDAFSDTGQDWKLPLYRWDVFAERDFDWLRQRAQRYATLYDGYRIDHLVGFYRTYYRPHDGSGALFSPPEQAEQEQLGESVLRVFRDSGVHLIAEDLGVVPDFVRESLARQGIPGYKVFRWERRWHEAGQPFIDPADYEPVSLATTGTHDTEPLVLWWEAAPVEERAAVLAIPSVRHRLEGDGSSSDGADAHQATLEPRVASAILQSLLASSSDYVILPVGDLFLWRDRINQPATVGPSNWTWRLPWPIDDLKERPEARTVATRLAAWSARCGRVGSDLGHELRPGVFQRDRPVEDGPASS